MKKIKMPCIRDIERYRKKGCPQQSWDRAMQEGCPCWIGTLVVDPANQTKTKMHYDCIDILAITQRSNMLRLLEGNQCATESLRNGMVEETPMGIRPKSDVATMQLVNVLEQAKRQIEG